MNTSGSIKAQFRYLGGVSQDFANASCLLTISVGQEVHEGDKFLATLALVEKSFLNCTVLVDDTLQRHSMQIEGSIGAAEAYAMALSAGDLWLDRYSHYLNQLSLPVKVMRWDDWLFHPAYNKQYNAIAALCTHDESYKAAFDQTITAFLTRYTNRRPIAIDYEAAYSLCFEYLKEECAVMCLWAQNHYNYEVYPARRNAAMSATHQRFILPMRPDVLHALAIKFKTRPAFNKPVTPIIKCGPQRGGL